MINPDFLLLAFGLTLVSFCVSAAGGLLLLWQRQAEIRMKLASIRLHVVSIEQTAIKTYILVSALHEWWFDASDPDMDVGVEDEGGEFTPDEATAEFNRLFPLAVPLSGTSPASRPSQDDEAGAVRPTQSGSDSAAVQGASKGLSPLSPFDDLPF